MLFENKLNMLNFMIIIIFVLINSYKCCSCFYFELVADGTATTASEWYN